jgi:hypothetical protein
LKNKVEKLKEAQIRTLLSARYFCRGEIQNTMLDCEFQAMAHLARARQNTGAFEDGGGKVPTTHSGEENQASGARCARDDE